MTAMRSVRPALLRFGIALLLLGALLFVASAEAAVDELTLISRMSGATGDGSNAASFAPSVSADGRYVAFESNGKNLSTQDVDARPGSTAGPVKDVFVRDTLTHTTTLISRANGGAGGDADSYSPSISADGRYVAFESKADNLSNADLNFNNNVFVRDTQLNRTILVSRQSGADGGAGADIHATNPSISADGRYVAFESNSYELSTADGDTFRDIFLRDTQANTTTLISRANGVAGAAADDNSFNASVSGDGRYVAYQSNANNLSTQDDNFFPNIFVRDTQANTNILVSRASGATGAGADGASLNPSISADGRVVGFESNGNNLSSSDNNRPLNVFTRVIPTNATKLISRASNGAGASGASYTPSVSTNGRYVAFASNAANLSTADNDLHRNIYLRDTVTNTTYFASRASGVDGVPGNGRSFSPSVSGDGRFVAFDSEARNLSTEDIDSPPGGGGGAGDPGIRDVFLRHVLP